LNKKYQHIFFDLDHTLWDYEKNAEATLSELFQHYNIANYGINFIDFLERCSENNKNVWDLYRKNIIDRDALRVKRFKDTFSDLGIDDKYFPSDLPDKFLQICPQHTHLVDGAKDTLDYLAGKYKIHILTNGFEETQHRKLTNCKIDIYFDSVITADSSGAKKPEKKIFDFALAENKALAEHSIMIGDEFEFDVVGAKNAGIDQVYYNPESKTHESAPTYAIKHLIELTRIL
jgi:putative hydrolase of the HAD superfamily